MGRERRGRGRKIVRRTEEGGDRTLVPPPSTDHDVSKYISRTSVETVTAQVEMRKVAPGVLLRREESNAVS
jgi:hypothetical protein